MILASRTTTIRYPKKPQAAVQYEIVLSKGSLTYNPNESAEIKGSLEWVVYKIEGESRTLMANSGVITCRCGYTDSPTYTAGTDTTDNVTFDDDGSVQRTYKKGETDKFTIVFGQFAGGVFTQLARLDIPVIVVGKDAAVVASIDFDNNNASILYNSITGKFVESSYPISNISVVEDGVDISETAKVHIKSYGLIGTITRDKSYTLSASFDADLVGTGVVGIKIMGMQSGSSNGYILASYTDSAGVTHSTRFNVSRSVGRYAAEIVTTPTQISYNQTTGVASSNKIAATLNVIDIYGNRTTNAPFTRFGAMEWRYVGADWTTYAPDPNSGQSASVLEIKNLDFTKSGVEFRFVDGSRNQLDYETVPFSSVTNGGDAYLVNVASMNVAVVLTSISYGKPTGDATNVVYMTKNNAVLSSGVEYNVPGDNGDEHTLAANGDKATDISYNGWHFNYLYLNGRLASALVRVEENSPTSVHIPIDVKYPTDNITRTVLISYSAIQKGPAGRSYKPNTPVLFEEGKEYKWDDEYRDFIYYAFKVNDKGEQDDEKGALSYFMYGVKEYGMTKVKTPPSLKGGDDNWEYVSEYKSIIVNCLFGTNAVLGGMVFTADTMTSQHKDSDGNPTIEIDGKKGVLKAKGVDISGTINATSGSFTGKITATSGTFDNCTIKETCTAGFMNYSANKLNGNVINCGLINFNDIGGTNDTTLYLPSVADGEFKKIIVMNFRATKSIVGNYTLAIEGGGRFHDFNNFPIIGGQIYPSTFTIEEGVYYEFVGIYKGGYTRWICVNRDLPRV